MIKPLLIADTEKRTKKPCIATVRIPIKCESLKHGRLLKPMFEQHCDEMEYDYKKIRVTIKELNNDKR
jgi:hypothetical protein